MSFSDNGYKIVRNAISKESAQIIVKQLEVLGGIEGNQDGDRLVVDSWSKYGSIITEGLSLYLHPTIESICEKKLYPTFTYMRFNYTGAQLPTHQDRPSCEYSLSLCLEPDEVEWEFWIKNKQNEEIPIIMEAGDMLVYKGLDIPHWRSEFKGSRHIQCFIHYVDADGQYADLKYDGREAMGMDAVKIKRKISPYSIKW
jgi:hypothetical protein